jgi:hypothetical protein
MNTLPQPSYVSTPTHKPIALSQPPQPQQKQPPALLMPMPQQPPMQGEATISEKNALSSAIKGIMDCDAKLKHLATLTAQLRQERLQYGEVLLQFMDSKNIQEFQTQGGGRITASASQPFKPLTKKDISSIMANYAGLPPAQTADIANFIIENRVRSKLSRKIVQKTSKTNNNTDK